MKGPKSINKHFYIRLDYQFLSKDKGIQKARTVNKPYNTYNIRIDTRHNIVTITKSKQQSAEQKSNMIQKLKIHFFQLILNKIFNYFDSENKGQDKVLL